MPTSDDRQVPKTDELIEAWSKAGMDAPDHSAAFLEAIKAGHSMANRLRSLQIELDSIRPNPTRMVSSDQIWQGWRQHRGPENLTLYIPPELELCAFKKKGEDHFIWYIGPQDVMKIEEAWADGQTTTLAAAQLAAQQAIIEKLGEAAHSIGYRMMPMTPGQK